MCISDSSVISKSLDFGGFDHGC